MPDERLDHALGELATLAATAVARSAEDLLGRSQRIVPHDEGTLAGSGHVVYIVNGVEFPNPGAAIAAFRVGGRSFAAEVRYDTPYAARRHEETHAPSGEPIRFSKPGRQAKYLETPLKEMAPRYEAVLAAAARRATT